MTVSGIGFNTNSLQAIRAKNAFADCSQRLKGGLCPTVTPFNASNQEAIKGSKETQNIPKDTGVKVSISSKAINTNLSSVNNMENDALAQKENSFVGEIKEFANRNNITNVEEDDIKEALKYGTSLFADYTA